MYLYIADKGGRRKTLNCCVPPQTLLILRVPIALDLSVFPLSSLFQSLSDDGNLEKSATCCRKFATDAGMFLFYGSQMLFWKDFCYNFFLKYSSWTVKFDSVAYVASNFQNISSSSVSVLEEGCCSLKNGNKVQMQNLYDRLLS